MNSSDSVNLTLTKYCNELNSDDKRQRRRAIENIRKEVLGTNANCKSVTSSFEQLQTQLIRCFKDNSESVREVAVLTVTEIIKTIPPKEIYLSNLMPVICERLSGDVVVENSEEVRLCIVVLLAQVISLYKDHLLPYMNDFINIFVKTLTDPYPKVKKESCDCTAELAKSIPQHFHMQSESLITPLVQTLSHQQYRIRVAGINSIGCVIQHGNNKSVSNVCGPLAERLFDQHHAVRAAVARVVASWLLQLPDRYSYFHKLIPLMLTCLTEEIPEQRQEAEKLWDKVGQQYMQENESDLKDKIDYLQERLDHYPSAASRPNLGCRTLVQRELSKYLPAVVLELEDWKSDVRVKSAQLLCVTVQHAEANVTQHLQKTLPALYRACAVTDPRVADNIELAAEMIGYFVPPDVYWKLMSASVEDSTSPGPLRVMAAILRCSQRPRVLPLLPSMVDTLDTEAICHSRQGQYQKQLLSVVHSLEYLMQEDLAPVSQQLFNVTLSVLGLSAHPSITKQAQELLEGLSKFNAISVEELYNRHTPALLERLAATVQEWTLVSPQRFVFEAILTNAGPAVGLNMSEIMRVLESSVGSQHEPEAVLQMLMAVSYVLTHSNSTLCEVTDLPQVVQDLCTRVIQPQLVWRAGRAAEALRTAATACVMAALELLSSPRSLVDSLQPLLLALLEDSAFKTRQYAALSLLSLVQSLRATESLTAQDINTIFPVVMKRLDDNNEKVRETAVQVLCKLFHTPLPTDFSVECYRSSLEALYDTMLLHLDDPVPSFQDIMFDALKEISRIHPQLLKSRIQVDNFTSKVRCEQLINFLENVHL